MEKTDKKSRWNKNFNWFLYVDLIVVVILFIVIRVSGNEESAAKPESETVSPTVAATAPSVQQPLQTYVNAEGEVVYVIPPLKPSIDVPAIVYESWRNVSEYFEGKQTDRLSFKTERQDYEIIVTGVISIELSEPQTAAIIKSIQDSCDTGEFGEYLSGEVLQLKKDINEKLEEVIKSEIFFKKTTAAKYIGSSVSTIVEQNTHNPKMKIVFYDRKDRLLFEREYR